MIKSISLFLNTCFFVGRIPIAPGTMGSIFALIIWYFLNPSLGFMITFLIVITLFSYYTISTTLESSNEKDPQYIVIDEAIGMWIALSFVSSYNLLNGCIAFLLFRLLDIFKPSIIYRLQFFSGALGVLLDDILAGLISGLIIAGIAII